MKVHPTEKLIALFKRLEGKGLRSGYYIDYNAELAALDADMKRGLCSRCCFADCRCAGEPIR